LSNHNSDFEFKALKMLEENPNLTQREISKELGISLGKTHYILKALISRGLLTLERFKTSENKIAYLYLLTPKGIIEKSSLAQDFLDRKQEEFERLKSEIEEMTQE
tara:strand:- start:764 stop:1081 length:318 start_codon:yes stop_codon:yes gene_type:complete